MLMNTQIYCNHCMNKTKDGAAFCMYCGKDPRSENLAHQLKAGAILNDRYLVGNVLGEGGFGITYIGFDLKLEMRIAIKEFFPAGFANRNNTVTNDVTLNVSRDVVYFDNAKEKYLREAQSIAKFSKESGIVNVRDYFEENGTAYIIMEYLEGKDLIQKIKDDGLFDAVYLFKLMIPIMHALDHVHNSQIIHRDIAPDNIKMAEDGTLKVFDFGAARFFAGDNKKTMSVTLKQGFTPYEQYTNGEQGPWTDVYGLCATIYKCITGKTPVDSLSRLRKDTLQKPSELGVRIPLSLENVLMYGLAIYPEHRCQSMQELINLTDKALRNEVVTVGGSSLVEEYMRQTKEQDDVYKTMFADEKIMPVQNQGDFVNNSANDYHNTNKYHNTNEYQSTNAYPTGDAYGKKNGNEKSKLVKGILISLLLVCCVLIGAIWFLLGVGDRDKDDNNHVAAESSVADANNSAEAEGGSNKDGASEAETTEVVEEEPEEENIYEEEEHILVANKITASSELEPYFTTSKKEWVYTYYARYVEDENLDSAWNEGVDGLGLGEYLEFYFPEGTLLTGGILYPGFYKDKNTFFENSAISSVEISSGGDSRIIKNPNLTEQYSDETNDKTFVFDQPLEVKDGVVRVTITSIREGTEYTDTCISEMWFRGYALKDEGNIKTTDLKFVHKDAKIKASEMDSTGLQVGPSTEIKK